MIGNKEIEKLKFSDLLLNEINLIIVSSDKNGNVIYVSPATEKICGYKPESLMGKQWWKQTYFSKKEGQLFKDRTCDMISGKIEVAAKPYERKLKCEDGSAKWIEWRDSLGENNTFVSVGVDIDEWKRTEVKKIQSDTILERINTLMMVSDIDGNILFASPSVEKILGYSLTEIMGDKWWKVTYENKEKALKVKNAVHKYVFYNEKDFVDIFKQKIKTSNGDYRWIGWQFSRGVNDTYISVGNDITEVILTDIELKKAKETAEKSLKVKTEFLANMSHEIRTPLNSIIGFTDLLLESELASEQRTHLETIRNSGGILLSVINDVLDFSKLESKKLETEKISFDLHKHTIEIVNLMKIKSQEKKISLDLIIEPNVFKDVIGDPTRLGQILLNLIGNAIKFTNKGSVTVTVKQLNETENTLDIYFEIKDTGIGIVSNKVNTVFGAFSQAKSDTSRIYGGTGLGLSIVKKLVNLLMGEIKVESTFGKGSLFKVILPFKKGSAEIKGKENEEAITMGQPLKLNILLVDDNKTNQLLAKTRLERWECKVDLAGNGIEAVKKTEQKTYDIILMDIQMPIMDGYEATKIIKNDISEAVSKIPIIAMTAYTATSEIDRALNAGMNDYVFKPFKPKELYRILKKYGKVSKKESKSKEIDNLDKLKEKTKKEVVKQYVDFKFLREETSNESSLLILLIDSFLNDIDEFLGIVDKELKHKKWKPLHEATHKIKPGISMFGVSKLEPIIFKLVDDFREEKQLEDVEDRINSCKEIFKLVRVELLTELKLLKNE